MNIVLIITAVFIGCFLYRTYYQIRYLAGVQRRVRHQKYHRFRWKEEADSPQPGVSVIVCARNESDNLRHYLQALTCQKYPEFEVIVVNDGSEDDTQLVLEQSAKLFRNLRLTFVPHDAWVRSSKKLALTLAVKAAKYDYLLLTDADCRPESPHWIEAMMRGFSKPETEIVVGYSGYFVEHTLLNRFIQYDAVFHALTYLGHALSRHPYMGVGRNLAYKKEMFFRHNGFAGTLSQRAGDDDLFVNKIATRKNTEVVLTPDSYTWSEAKHSFAEWRIQKYRHLSVAPDYRLATRLRLTAEPVVRLVWYATFVALMVLPALVTQLLPFSSKWLAVAVFLLSFLTQAAIIARAKRIFRVDETLSVLHLPSYLIFDLYLPLSNLAMLIRHRLRRKKESQW